MRAGMPWISRRMNIVHSRPEPQRIIADHMRPPRCRVVHAFPGIFDINNIQIYDVDDDRVTIVVQGNRRSAPWPDIERAVRYPEQKPNLRELYLAISETGQAILEARRHQEDLVRQRACIVEVGPDEDRDRRWRVYLDGWVPQDFQVSEDDCESFGVYEDAALQGEHTSRRLECLGVKVLRQFDLEDELRQSWFPDASMPGRDTLDPDVYTGPAGSVSPRFAWLEFPLYAESDTRIRDALRHETRYRRDPGREERLVRLVTFRARGRFPLIEEALRRGGIPYDLGGEDGFSGLRWSGWWRQGHGEPRIFELAPSGETLVSLDEIRNLTRAPNSAGLRRAIDALIEQSDPSPPDELTTVQPRLHLI